MNIEAHFTIRRFWLRSDTPVSVLDTLTTVRTGRLNMKLLPYVDINYHGDSDRNITIMELKYGEWIVDREQISYVVTGDDGLT